jgi:hypothetical protein
MVSALPGLELPAARPLVPLEACMFLLDEHEDRIIASIEDGTLSLAWDIASPGSQRREVRVWRDSLLAVMRRERGPATAEVRPIIEAMLPGRDLLHREVQRLLSCSGTHVSELLNLEALLPAGPRPTRSSPMHFTRVLRVSVVTFLERRIIR